MNEEETEMNSLIKLGAGFIIFALLGLAFVMLIVTDRGGFGLAGGTFQIIGSLFMIGFCLVFLGWREGEDE
jgi:hypothetical protein